MLGTLTHTALALFDVLEAHQNKEFNNLLHKTIELQNQIRNLKTAVWLIFWR